MNDRRDGDEADPPSPSDDDGDENVGHRDRTHSGDDGSHGEEADSDETVPDEAGLDEPSRQSRHEMLGPEPSTEREATAAGNGSGEDVPAPGEDPVGWFLNTRNSSVLLFKDIASSIAIVAIIGLVLFSISGVWPPLVAIESGSMEPHMEKGDLVFLTENDRLASNDAVAAGVVTHEAGEQSGYTKFGDHGDVIIFRPNGQQQTPIIHRAHLYVEENENWYDRANSDYMRADNCAELSNCPAPHDGFVTKGDNPNTNRHYDQVDRYQIVKPEWVEGTAEVRVPYLGCIRLEFSETESCRL